MTLRRMPPSAVSLMKTAAKAVFRLIPFKKTAALITALCFVLATTGPAMAGAAEYAAEAHPPRAADMLPQTAGRVTETGNFGSRLTVVALQDLHCHPEVQKNIARTLEKIDAICDVSKVYLEGASGEVDTSWIDSIAEDTLRTKVVESLLEQGRLTGAEYYAIRTGRHDAIAGLEDGGKHSENILRLRRIMDRQGAAARIIDDMEADFSTLRDRYYSRGQRRFSVLGRRYADGKLTADKYYHALNSYCKRLHIDIGAYHNISRLVELSDLEKKLHYGRISRQLGDYIQTLKRYVPYREYTHISELAREGSRLDELSMQLISIERAYGIKLSLRYPQLSEFFAYVLLGQGLNPSGLVSEERRLVGDIRSALAETKFEREVVFVDEFLGLLRDYFGNRITQDDHAYVTANLAEFNALWAKYLAGERLALLVPYFELLGEFYAANIERNRIFINHVLSGRDDAGRILNPAKTGETRDAFSRLAGAEEVVVMVTGGFHTRGVCDLLRERGISYLVITPNVTKDTGIAEKAYAELARQQAGFLTGSLALLPITKQPARILAERIAGPVLTALIPGGATRGQAEETLNGVFAELLRRERVDGLSSADKGAIRCRVGEIDESGSCRVYIIQDGETSEYLYRNEQGGLIVRAEDAGPSQGPVTAAGYDIGGIVSIVTGQLAQQLGILMETKDGQLADLAEKIVLRVTEAVGEPELMADDEAPGHGSILQLRDEALASNIELLGALGLRSADDVKIRVAKGEFVRAAAEVFGAATITRGDDGYLTVIIAEGFLNYLRSRVMSAEIIKQLIMHELEEHVYLTRPDTGNRTYIDFHALPETERTYAHLLNVVRSFISDRTGLGLSDFSRIFAPFVKGIERLQFDDNLTGISNSAFFGLALKQKYLEWNRSGKDGGKKFSVMMIDLNNFKLVNDRFGHPVGDEALRGVAQVLSSAVRDSDIACRIGGDEFAVLLPDADEEGAMLVAERILKAFGSAAMLADSGRESEARGFGFGLSIGIAEISESTDADGVVRSADAALYRSKARGNNCVTVYGDLTKEGRHIFDSGQDAGDPPALMERGWESAGGATNAEEHTILALVTDMIESALNGMISLDRHEIAVLAGRVAGEVTARSTRIRTLPFSEEARYSSLLTGLRQSLYHNRAALEELGVMNPGFVTLKVAMGDLVPIEQGVLGGAVARRTGQGRLEVILSEGFLRFLRNHPRARGLLDQKVALELERLVFRGGADVTGARYAEMLSLPAVQSRYSEVLSEERAYVGEHLHLGAVELGRLFGPFIREVERKGFRDTLTGISNRAYFNRVLEQKHKEWSRCRTDDERRAKQYSVVLIDLDHFKEINDGYGHAEGNKVLRAVAALMQRLARESDITCRFGGDEFTMILPATGEDGAALLAERIRVALRDDPFLARMADEIRFGMSIGAAQAEHGISSEEVLARADAATSRSKARGRNRVTTYGSMKEQDDEVIRLTPGSVSSELLKNLGIEDDVNGTTLFGTDIRQWVEKILYSETPPFYDEIASRQLNEEMGRSSGKTIASIEEFVLSYAKKLDREQGAAGRTVQRAREWMDRLKEAARKDGVKQASYLTGHSGPYVWAAKGMYIRHEHQRRLGKLFGSIDVKGMKLKDLPIWPVNDDGEILADLLDGWFVPGTRAPPLRYPSWKYYNPDTRKVSLSELNRLQAGIKRETAAAALPSRPSFLKRAARFVLATVFIGVLLSFSPVFSGKSSAAAQRPAGAPNGKAAVRTYSIPTFDEQLASYKDEELPERFLQWLRSIPDIRAVEGTMKVESSNRERMGEFTHKAVREREQQVNAWIDRLWSYHKKTGKLDDFVGIRSGVSEEEAAAEKALLLIQLTDPGTITMLKERGAEVSIEEDLPSIGGTVGTMLGGAAGRPLIKLSSAMHQYRDPGGKKLISPFKLSLTIVHESVHAENLPEGYVAALLHYNPISLLDNWLASIPSDELEAIDKQYVRYASEAYNFRLADGASFVNEINLMVAYNKDRWFVYVLYDFLGSIVWAGAFAFLYWARAAVRSFRSSRRDRRYRNTGSPRGGRRGYLGAGVDSLIGPAAEMFQDLAELLRNPCISVATKIGLLTGMRGHLLPEESLGRYAGPIELLGDGIAESWARMAIEGQANAGKTEVGIRVTNNPALLGPDGFVEATMERYRKGKITLVQVTVHEAFLRGLETMNREDAERMVSLLAFHETFEFHALDRSGSEPYRQFTAYLMAKGLSPVDDRGYERLHEFMLERFPEQSELFAYADQVAEQLREEQPEARDDDGQATSGPEEIADAVTHAALDQAGVVSSALRLGAPRAAKEIRIKGVTNAVNEIAIARVRKYDAFRTVAIPVPRYSLRSAFSDGEQLRRDTAAQLLMLRKAIEPELEREYKNKNKSRSALLAQLEKDVINRISGGQVNVQAAFEDEITRLLLSGRDRAYLREFRENVHVGLMRAYTVAHPDYETAAQWEANEIALIERAMRRIKGGLERRIAELSAKEDTESVKLLGVVEIMTDDILNKWYKQDDLSQGRGALEGLYLLYHEKFMRMITDAKKNAASGAIDEKALGSFLCVEEAFNLIIEELMTVTRESASRFEDAIRPYVEDGVRISPDTDAFVRLLSEEVPNRITRYSESHRQAVEAVALLCLAKPGLETGDRDNIEYLRDRILQKLAGWEETAVETAVRKRDERLVLVTNGDIFPTELMKAFDAYNIQAIASERGTSSSHFSIYAAGQGLPAVSGAQDVFRKVDNGDLVIIDGTSGMIIVHPDPETLSEYIPKSTDLVALNRTCMAAAHEPVISLDGIGMEIHANADLESDVKHAAAAGCPSIGLVRTEYMYDQDDVPNAESLRTRFSILGKAARGGTVTLRLFDRQADKRMNCFSSSEHFGSAFYFRTGEGNRAVREEIEAALLSYLETPNIRIMFPMISSREDADRARELFEEVRAQVKDRTENQHQKRMLDEVKAGSMIETSAAVENASYIMQKFDFVSIGTNDLTKFSFGVDRDEPGAAKYFNILQPAILSQIVRVLRASLRVEKLTGRRVEVDVCGDLAHMPEFILFALGAARAIAPLNLSMPASFIPLSKEIIRNNSARECADLFHRVFEMEDDPDIDRLHEASSAAAAGTMDVIRNSAGYEQHYREALGVEGDAAPLPVDIARVAAQLTRGFLRNIGILMEEPPAGPHESARRGPPSLLATLTDAFAQVISRFAGGPRRAGGAHRIDQLKVSLSLADLGAEVRDGEITYHNSLKKALKLLPDLAGMGAGSVYLYGGVYEISALSKKLHRVPDAGKHYIREGNAVVVVRNYDVKNTEVDGVQLDDRFGNYFSIYGMDRLNPQVSGNAQEARLDLERFIKTARGNYGMNVTVDFNPWFAPDAITGENYRRVVHRELNEEERSLADEALLDRDGGWCVVYVTEHGQTRRILVRHLEIGVTSKDQVTPNVFSPELIQYYKDSLKTLIDAGADAARVDLPRLVLKRNVPFTLTPGQRDGPEPFEEVIRYAKRYAREEYGREFGFVMEHYHGNEPAEDLQDLLHMGFEQSGPGRPTRYYYDNVYKDYRSYAQALEQAYEARQSDVNTYHRRLQDARNSFAALRGSFAYAAEHKDIVQIYASNFDEQSLKNLGGNAGVFLEMLMFHAAHGVPVMMDLRELLDHRGHIITVAGGKNGMTQEITHPFPDPGEFRRRQDFEGLVRELRASPVRSQLAAFLEIDAASATRTILDTSDQGRFMAMLHSLKDGGHVLSVGDALYHPAGGYPSSLWVELPEQVGREIDEIAGAAPEGALSDVVRRYFRLSDHASEDEVPFDILRETVEGRMRYRIRLHVPSGPGMHRFVLRRGEERSAGYDLLSTNDPDRYLVTGEHLPGTGSRIVVRDLLRDERRAAPGDLWFDAPPTFTADAEDLSRGLTEQAALKLIRQKYAVKDLSSGEVVPMRIRREYVDGAPRYRLFVRIPAGRKSLDLSLDIARGEDAVRNAVLYDDPSLLLRDMRSYFRKGVMGGVRIDRSILRFVEVCAQAVASRSDHPVEGSWPFLKALVQLQKEEELALIRLLRESYEGAARPLLVDNILLLHETVTGERWLREQAPELSGRKIYYVSPEITLWKGGLGPVMTFHSLGMKRLGADIETIEPMYQLRVDRGNKNGDPMDYRDEGVRDLELLYSYEIRVGDRPVNVEVWKGYAEDGMAKYFVKDVQEDGGSYYTRMVYDYSTEGNPVSWEEFVAFFNIATAELVYKLETEREGRLGKAYKGGVVHGNDGQNGPLQAIMLSRYGERGSRAVDSLMWYFTTHTYFNRGMKSIDDVRDVLRNMMHVKDRYLPMAMRPGLGDYTSIGVRPADGANGVSAIHSDNQRHIDAEWSYLVGITNGAVPAMMARIFRGILTRLFGPGTDEERPTPAQVRRAKEESKAYLNSLNILTANGIDLHKELRSRLGTVIDTGRGPELLTDQRLQEVLRERGAFVEVDPRRIVISYCRRLAPEKGGLQRAFTRENIEQLVMSGAQVILFGNQQLGYDRSNQMAEYLKGLERHISELKRNDPDRYPGRFQFVNAFDSEQKKAILAAQDIGVKDSDRDSGAAEVSEEDDSANGSWVLSPPWREGVIMDQGVNIATESRTVILNGRAWEVDYPVAGSGSVIVPKDESPEAYLRAFLGAIALYSEDTAGFHENSALSVRVNRVMYYLLTCASYLREYNKILARKADELARDEAAVRDIVNGIDDPQVIEDILLHGRNNVGKFDYVRGSEGMFSAALSGMKTFLREKETLEERFGCDVNFEHLRRGDFERYLKGLYSRLHTKGGEPAPEAIGNWFTAIGEAEHAALAKQDQRVTRFMNLMASEMENRESYLLSMGKIKERRKRRPAGAAAVTLKKAVVGVLPAVRGAALRISGTTGTLPASEHALKGRNMLIVTQGIRPSGAWLENVADEEIRSLIVNAYQTPGGGEPLVLEKLQKLNEMRVNAAAVTLKYRYAAVQRPDGSVEMMPVDYSGVNMVELGNIMVSLMGRPPEPVSVWAAPFPLPDGRNMAVFYLERPDITMAINPGGDEESMTLRALQMLLLGRGALRLVEDMLSDGRKWVDPSGRDSRDITIAGKLRELGIEFEDPDGRPLKRGFLPDIIEMNGTFAAFAHPQAVNDDLMHAAELNGVQMSLSAFDYLSGGPELLPGSLGESLGINPQFLADITKGRLLDITRLAFMTADAVNAMGMECAERTKREYPCLRDTIHAMLSGVNVSDRQAAELAPLVGLPRKTVSPAGEVVDNVRTMVQTHRKAKERLADFVKRYGRTGRKPNTDLLFSVETRQKIQDKGIDAFIAAMHDDSFRRRFTDAGIVQIIVGNPQVGHGYGWGFARVRELMAMTEGRLIRFNEKTGREEVLRESVPELKGRVIYVPGVDVSETGILFQGADIVNVFSRIGTGAPASYMNGFLNAVPVLATRTGGPLENVVDVREDPERGNGIFIAEYDPEGKPTPRGVIDALAVAAGLYRDDRSGLWESMMWNALQTTPRVDMDGIMERAIKVIYQPLLDRKNAEAAMINNSNFAVKLRVSAERPAPGLQGEQLSDDAGIGKITFITGRARKIREELYADTFPLTGLLLKDRARAVFKHAVDLRQVREIADDPALLELAAAGDTSDSVDLQVVAERENDLFRRGYEALRKNSGSDRWNAFERFRREHSGWLPRDGSGEEAGLFAYEQFNAYEQLRAMLEESRTLDQASFLPEITVTPATELSSIKDAVVHWIRFGFGGVRLDMSSLENAPPAIIERFLALVNDAVLQAAPDAIVTVLPPASALNEYTGCIENINRSESMHMYAVRRCLPGEKPGIATQHEWLEFSIPGDGVLNVKDEHELEGYFEDLLASQASYISFPDGIQYGYASENDDFRILRAGDIRLRRLITSLEKIRNRMKTRAGLPVTERDQYVRGYRNGLHISAPSAEVVDWDRLDELGSFDLRYDGGSARLREIVAPGLYSVLESYDFLRRAGERGQWSMQHHAYQGDFFSAFGKILDEAGLGAEQWPEGREYLRVLERKTLSVSDMQTKVRLTAQAAGFMRGTLEQMLEARYIARSGKTLPEKAEDRAFLRPLLFAAYAFIARKNGVPCLINSHPWSGLLVGRDIFISLPGLLLTLGELDAAKHLFTTFAGRIRNGIIPYSIDSNDNFAYNSNDTSLWFVEALYRYFEKTRDRSFVREMLPAVRQILAWHTSGTEQGLKRDADGLLAISGEADGSMREPGRNGKTVELQALYHNAMLVLAEFERLDGDRSEAGDWERKAHQIADAVREKYFAGNREYPFDTIEGSVSADPSIRPNALLLVSLSHNKDLLPLNRQEQMLATASRELLTPHGVRTLSLNDDEYHGQSTRPEAQFNGSAWVRLLGSHAETVINILSQKQVSDSQVDSEIRMIINSSLRVVERTGALPARFSGDSPYVPDGPVNDAAAVAEVLRMFDLITERKFRLPDDAGEAFRTINVLMTELMQTAG